MTDPANLKSLLHRLGDELEEASKYLRLQPEWKEGSTYAHRLRMRVAEVAEDPEAVDDTIRELQAQLDLLSLGRDRANAEEKRLALEKNARREQDTAVMAELVSSLKVYGWLVASSFLLTPIAAYLFANIVVLSGVPAAMGYARMTKARAPTVGRHWVILRGDVDVVLERAAFYDKACMAAVATPLVWLIFKNLMTT
jgi:hypothetical protein